MSIENSITKLAEAISNIAQSGNAIAASINRYCDLSQAEAVSTGGDVEIKEVIDKAVAKFEAEHEEHKAKADKAEPVVEEVAEGTEEAEPVVEEEVEAESDKPVTFEEAKSIVIDTVSSKGKPAVAAIFKQLGAKNLPGLEPSQYSELVALCKAA